MQPFLLLVALGPTAMAFSFTGPDVDSKLNLSAPITISWEDFRGENSSVFDLWWHGALADDGGTFGHSLKENLTEASGEFLWDPTNITDGLAKEKNHLSTDDVFYFEALIHDKNDTATTEGMVSDEFAVEGYELMGSSGSFARPATNVLVAVAAVAGALLI
ncbi:hypothetical protein B0J13DRAFT_525952 [Dactylonectria estremocensis]|uniref:Uncharacterized protein n=1 Tax=Dactylonectria estremocensis TaxID=1079267 RepID=A0A9P9J5F3_9HYPO|nr:hypothetical protein B0J13DRAFT_525952 [Dactylonectria estremocensis]